MKFIAALFALLSFASFVQSDKKKIIYLVRRGDTEADTPPIPKVLGKSSIPLNDEGIAHCKGAGDFLANENIGKIYYSELKRARQSAEIIAGQHSTKVEMILENSLIEISWGLFESYYYHQEFDDKLAEKFMSHPEKFIIPLGEDFYFVMNRLRLFFTKFWESDEDTCTIVSHGYIINILSLMLLQAPIEKFWSMNMSPCAVSKIQMKSLYSFTIEYWNINHFFKEAEKKYLKNKVSKKNK